jgi:hypothetical protein
MAIKTLHRIVGLMEDLREAEWEFYIKASVEQNRCPYSGLNGPECKSWLCDCFEFEDIWGVSQK